MMHARSFLAASACLFAALTLPCAHAGEATTPGEKSEFYSALSLAMPVLIASGVAGSVFSAPVAASNTVAESRREARAGKLPPMRVQAVDTLPAGARQVRLQDPQQAENTAVLQWQARQDDPAAGFHVGEMVTFQPSPAGSGWTVHAEQGQALAFVPTEAAAAYGSSQTW
ncbi:MULTISPECIES: hypothetical protein [Xanthomonas]|uniref:hypothetical protein n=1 Tax=Xanthomonas TaxID=338 RepID=UPI002405B018|nr:hypothetical protein [Xanthomonas euvesicatoria]MCP3035540.1 hypothetical protein [Xanthomonas euvesicatoria pv. allii]MCP3041218.1 hypothetical protein [Xanthomonas euvesicatoria pv. allii]MCP3053203.1 hypothetical protein [Xanthomonas euvesicatoria pv. allii]